MASKYVLAGFLTALGACDGDGCYGGPNGAATKFCQDTIARLADAGPGGAPDCASCCVQEVHYDGRVDPKTGLCVCW